MIPPSALAQAIRTAAPFPGGPTFDTLCQAIASSVTTWLPGGVNLVGVTTGTVGVGTVTGTLVFIPNPALILAAFSTTIQGATASLTAATLATGLAVGLTGLTYLGTSAGVGLGTDISRVASVNTPLLAQTLRTTHTSMCLPQGGTGALVPGYYEALAGAISSIILTGQTLPPTGVVAPSGPLGPSASVGVSTSIPV